MMLHIGMENWINSDKIIAVKKYTIGSRVANKLLNEKEVVNMAGRKKTKCLIIMVDNIAIRSILSPDTIVSRMNRMVDSQIENALTYKEEE